MEIDVPDSGVADNTIRRIVVEEVEKRLGPLTVEVGRLGVGFRSLYRNGSGGPPGYLETARTEDNERYERLFQMVNDLIENKTIVNEFIAVAKERDKAAKEREVKQTEFRKKVLKLGWKVCAGLIAGMITLGATLYHAAQPVVKIIWEDYLKAHPIAAEQLKNISVDNEPVVSSRHIPSQDAKTHYTLR